MATTTQTRGDETMAKTVPTFRADGELLVGVAAIKAWKAQDAFCACGDAGDEADAVSGEASDMPAEWLGCPNCSGRAVGHPLIYRLPSQVR